jgi:hypothetical protein
MWTELRVHGVSGTPPESLLDFERVRQVAGDESSRFFRRFDENGAELLDDEPGPAPHRVEAFHWGRFTSGTWNQAFWLLLAPFGVINAAQFMLPFPRTTVQRVAHAVAGAMLRIMGLALTLLIVLAAAVVLLDLLAWQRLGVPPPAGPLTGPGFRLAATGGLAACGLVPALLSWLTKSPREADDDAIPTGTLARPTDPPTDLVRPGFFEGAAVASGLRRLHSAAALSLLGVIGGGAAGVAGVPGATVVLDLALAVLAATVLTVLLVGDPGRSASVQWDNGLDAVRDAVHRIARGLAWAVFGASLPAFALGVAWVARIAERPSDDPASHFPMLDLVSGYAVYVGAGALVVLYLAAVALWTGPTRPRAFRPYARGLAAPLVASLGLFIGVGYTGALTVVVSNLLNALGATFRLDAPPSTYAGQVPDVLARAVRTQVHAPELLSRIVHAWGLTAVAAVLVVGAALVGRQLTRGTARERVAADALALLPHRWVEKVATAMWLARLKNYLVPILATFSLVGLLLSALTAAEVGMPGDTPGELPGALGWFSASADHPDVLSGPLLWLGSAILALLAATLLAVGRSGVKDGSTRRGANVLWDVVAFWPRSVHPFVPPAYSQWAVPDLERRVRTLGPVVVCGHSQGSLISVAALLRLGHGDPSTLADVGLLTFGSQLQVMFARAFPAYVDLETLRWLHQAVTWRNLYRETDHLAGPVLSWDHRWAGRPPDDLAPPVSRAPRTVAERVAAADEGPFARNGGTTAAGPPWRVAESFPPLTGPAPSPATRERGQRRREFGPDWCLPDPPLPDARSGVPTHGPDLSDSPLLELRRHGAYWRDPAWTSALAAIRGTPWPVSPVRLTSPHPTSPDPADLLGEK